MHNQTIEIMITKQYLVHLNEKCKSPTHHVNTVVHWFGWRVSLDCFIDNCFEYPYFTQVQ